MGLSKSNKLTTIDVVYSMIPKHRLINYSINEKTVNFHIYTLTEIIQSTFLLFVIHNKDIQFKICRLMKQLCYVTLCGDQGRGARMNKPLNGKLQ